MDIIDRYFHTTQTNPTVLAEAMGVSPSAFYRIVKGERPPTVKWAEKVEVATAGRIAASEFMVACLHRNRAFKTGQSQRLNFRRANEIDVEANTTTSDPILSSTATTQEG